MEELEFYKKQYAFLMGEMDRAVTALEHCRFEDAQHILTAALAAAEQRWIDATSSESFHKP